MEVKNLLQQILAEMLPIKILFEFMEAVYKHLTLLLLTGAFLALLTWGAKKRGYYRLPPLSRNPDYRITTVELASVFLLFAGMEMFFMPAVVLLWEWIQGGSFADLLKMGVSRRGWLNLATVICATLAIIFYTCSLDAVKRQFIVWGPNPTQGVASRIKDVLVGVTTWILSYPIVILISQFVALIFIFAGPLQHQDQVAVKYLKTSLTDPWLFWSNIVLIVTLVPIGEELLFRGFLQRWLVQRIGRLKGIILASICFALFHFSFSQKWDNIDLILSLFALSCYLGFIYERQQSLLAPISLHMTFNGISLAMLILGEWKNA